MNPWRIAFLGALALWPGCASQAPPPVVSPSSQLRPPSAPLVEEFDPQSLDEDLLLIQPTFAPPVMPAASPSAPPFAFSEPPGPVVPPPSEADALRLSAVSAPDDTAATLPLVAVFGWRVRLDKVDSYQQAESIRATAVSDLRRTDIDITFTTPYYNIEVGHYRTEVEAQQALERLRRRYPYALMVRGQILVPAEE